MGWVRGVRHALTLHFSNACTVPQTVFNKRLTDTGSSPSPSIDLRVQLNRVLSCLSSRIFHLAPSSGEGWLEDAVPLA